ncbi:MAG: prepilin peptidase, partial [Desulfovermiculus sp.]
SAPLSLESGMDVLIIFVIAAALYDLKFKKIPNLLNLTCAILMIGMHTVTGGLSGFLGSFAGLALGMIVMLGPYVLGMMGGGDVKLMAAVGAGLGPSLTLHAILITCLAGGLYAFLILLFHPRIFKRFILNIKDTFLIFLGTKKFSYSPADRENRLPTLCYGVPIAVGTISTIAMSASGFSVWTLLK